MGGKKKPVRNEPEVMRKVGEYVLANSYGSIRSIFTRRRFAGSPDIEDCMQEWFAIVMDKFQRLWNPDACSMEEFLSRVAYTSMLVTYSKLKGISKNGTFKNRHRPVFFSLYDDSNDEFDAHIREDLLAVYAPKSTLEIYEEFCVLCNFLPRNERLCLTLRAVNGLSTKEIMSLLGIKKRTVEQYIHNAKQKYIRNYNRLMEIQKRKETIRDARNDLRAGGNGQSEGCSGRRDSDAI